MLSGKLEFDNLLVSAAVVGVSTSVNELCCDGCASVSGNVRLSVGVNEG